MRSYHMIYTYWIIIPYQYSMLIFIVYSRSAFRMATSFILNFLYFELPLF